MDDSGKDDYVGTPRKETRVPNIRLFESHQSLGRLVVDRDDPLA